MKTNGTSSASAAALPAQLHRRGPLDGPYLASGQAGVHNRRRKLVGLGLHRRVQLCRLAVLAKAIRHALHDHCTAPNTRCARRTSGRSARRMRPTITTKPQRSRESNQGGGDGLPARGASAGRPRNSVATRGPSSCTPCKSATRFASPCSYRVGWNGPPATDHATRPREHAMGSVCGVPTPRRAHRQRKHAYRRTGAADGRCRSAPCRRRR